jgi:hypothetical protein
MFMKYVYPYFRYDEKKKNHKYPEILRQAGISKEELADLL